MTGDGSSTTMALLSTPILSRILVLRLRPAVQKGPQPLSSRKTREGPLPAQPQTARQTANIKSVRVSTPVIRVGMGTARDPHHVLIPSSYLKTEASAGPFAYTNVLHLSEERSVVVQMPKKYECTAYRVLQSNTYSSEPYRLQPLCLRLNHHYIMKFKTPNHTNP